MCTKECWSSEHLNTHELSVEDIHCTHEPISENIKRVSSPPKMVSIIISNFNGGEHLGDCLSSLLELNYPRYEVIVVDAGSTDKSPQMVKEDFPWVKLMEKGRIGIGEAINYGISAAKGEIIAFDLNSDDIVDPNWLNPLVEALVTSRDVGIVCGKRLRYGTNGVLDCAGGKINKFTGDTPVIGQGRSDSKEYSVQREVDYVPVIVTKREVTKKIGLCDPSFFIYFEDTDFCIRARKAGYKIIYIPSAIFWHKGSSTIGKFSYRGYYYLHRNQIWFIVKHFPTVYMMSALIHNLLTRPCMESFIAIRPIHSLLDFFVPSFRAYTQHVSSEEHLRVHLKIIIWISRNLKKLFQARYRQSLRCI